MLDFRGQNKSMIAIIPTNIIGNITNHKIKCSNNLEK
jgi:hypothetical protein